MLSYGIVISILIGLFMQVSHAEASMGPGPTKNFVNEVDLLNQNCQGLKCKNPYTIVVLYRRSARADFGGLDMKSKYVLMRVAYEQAQIWGDTILEGDFVADGKTRLDEVQALYKNKTLIGYKITYSERAWFTADCSYDGIHKETLRGCTEGRILEASYVSTDFAYAFYTMDSGARFIRP
jgi:hypothetical protein